LAVLLGRAQAGMSERVWYRHPPTCWALGDIAQSRGTSVLLRDVETSEEVRSLPDFLAREAAHAGSLQRCV
jgi:hypothetical protein